MTRRIALLALILVGCGGLNNREDDLNKTLLQFTDAVRWSKWQIASAYVEPEKRPKWLAERVAGARNLNIADVVLQGLDRKGVNAQEATVFVQMTFFRLPDTTLQRTLWKQSWKHDKSGWKLIEEKPVENVPEPIMEEPPAQWP